MKKYNVLLVVMFSMMLIFSGSASAKYQGQQISQTGYDLQLGPGVNMVDNSDGTHTIRDTFDFYKNGLNSQELTPADFVVYEDDVVVNANIIPPGTSNVQQKADIVFCMDISGSMQSSINAVKANTQAFVSNLNSRNFDVQLGLITFGEYQSPYLKTRNNGQFYSSTAAFLADFSKLGADGWQEEWFDANVLASQYSFRPGASRIIILITDENGDNLNYNISTSIQVVKNNATTIYSITEPYLSNAVRAATETGGQVYNIRSNFNTILDSIARQIANRYEVSYLSNASAGNHKLKVAIAQNGNFDIAEFKIGANPVVSLTSATNDMINKGVPPGGSNLTIGANITDDGKVALVEIYGTKADGTTYIGTMNISGNIYTYDIDPPNSLGSCLNFTIKAVDDEGRATISGPYKICAASNPPVIGIITPDEYDYNVAIPVTANVTDPDGDSDITSVILEAKTSGTLNWSAPFTMSLSGTTYTATLPASIAGFGGLDIRVTATDKMGITTKSPEKTITLKTIPVTILDVTTHRDIIDTDGNGEGPFAVYAVVAGVDTTINGNSVNLYYTVGGGAESEMKMTQTVVTSGQAALASNSNIYLATIPAESSGAKICYYVKAANPTPQSATSTNICFEIIQPAKPLEITPTYAVVTPGENVAFVATGGNGTTYEWQTLNGTLSSTLGATTTYTAGMVADGWDKVVVKDIKGFTTTAKIRVMDSLAISPDVNGKKFAPSSTVTLNATGGEPGYTWDVTGAESSKVSDDSTSVTITLGSAPATIKVVLKDSKARTAQVQFTNNGKLELTPGDTQVDPGKDKTFSVTGGLEPYTWKVYGGDLDSYSVSSVTYKAPQLPGVYHISVEDSGGQSANAKIQVGTPLMVTPSGARIMRGATQDFEVVTGTPPYTWTVPYGKLSSTTGAKVTFTPENHLGVYIVTVVDGVQSMQVMTVEVSEGLVVTPSIAQVQKGKTKTFTVTGGQGGYNWSAVRGSVNPPQGSSQVDYTAPSELGDGKDTVTVRDTAGNTATVNITVTEGSLDALTITPAEATVAPAGSVDFTVNNAANDPNTGSSKILWTATKGTITTGGKYTAPSSSGTYTVSVTDILNGRTASATIFVSNELLLTPNSATVGANGSKTFTVSGGEAPYSWSVAGEGDLDATTGQSVTFTATAKAGTSNLIVIDNTGKKAQAAIDITGAIIITPANITLAPLATITFSTPGVSGVNWIAEKGTIDSKGNYTAPADLGKDTVTAKDNAGNEATASVTVGNIPVITPAMAWLEKSGMSDFDVVGGTPPYTWSVTAGKITPSTSSASYTAPGVSGEYTINVKDSLGQESTAVVYVELPLKATRQEIFLKPGETAKIAVTGGIPPFDWQTIKGDMQDVRTLDAGYNYYTAPNVMGEDTITIRDKKGAETTVAVHVTQPLQVTPSIRYIERKESKNFTVVSGVGPYTAAIIDGDGDIVQSKTDEKIFTFTAGSTADDDVVIEISDNSGQKVQVHAYVETSLKVTPSIIYLDKNSKTSFRVSGGTGGYVATASAGFAEVDPETGKGVYESPSRTGKYTITVYDSKDQELKIQVEVAKTTPVISPSVVYMEAGEKRTFMVNMGAAPYDWSFEGALVNKLTDDGSTVEIVAPNVARSYKLKVSDAAGMEAEATVSVSQPLLISPSAMTIYQGTSPSLRISALGGIAPYQWSGTEIIPEGKDGESFAIIKPSARVEVGKSYTVSCRDSAGATASMNVIVSRLPGDLNGDGVLNDDEMKGVINAYVEGSAVQGVDLNPETVYSHVEAFTNTPTE